jgi:hypothetical protein
MFRYERCAKPAAAGNRIQLPQLDILAKGSCVETRAYATSMPPDRLKTQQNCKREDDDSGVGFGIVTSLPAASCPLGVKGLETAIHYGPSIAGFVPEFPLVGELVGALSNQNLTAANSPLRASFRGLGSIGM